jgi:dienelactone hydrolase
MISNEHKSKGGIATHTRARVAATTRTQDKNEHRKEAHRVYNSKKCSNLYHNEPDACMRSIGIIGCSMGAWCAVPFA